MKFAWILFHNFGIVEIKKTDIWVSNNDNYCLKLLLTVA